ncbi:MAG TPA: transketolase [Alphaproteobacteria bacterium]
MTVPKASPAASDVVAAPSQRDLANAIRALAMDSVEAAKSGHPGMPMGMADVATVLVHRFLAFDAAAPDWPDRDRLVLSAGHGSMLLYAILYLTGTAGMTIDDIRNFRQLGSPAAGHPEYGHAPGIETTTGPLGQGLANAVGMALAERLMAARYGADLVDHFTYVIASDGDLMEGISHEAASLAGHLRLAKLIVLFDDNHVSIDGPTELAVSDDQPARFRALGWDVAACDGHDAEAVAAAIARARRTDRPSLIACRTTIGYGAPTKQGTAATHGAPLGADEVALARARLGWPSPPFEVPAAVLGAWRTAGRRGAAARVAWQARLAAAPARARFERVLAGTLPDGLAPALAALKARLASDAPRIATRKASEIALEVINAEVECTVGGSADLTGSNNTRTKGMAAVAPGDFAGRYVFYGVREHAMAAVMNGIALHKGLIPYGGTFLIFSDYARPAMRLAALMGLRVIYVLTHDSIGLGEDGPTHQPVEHLASLRAMPNLWVFRPADAIECAECWELALARSSGPSVIALTRQGVPCVRAGAGPANRSAEGAYEIAAAEGRAQATILATGSEVAVALAARAVLEGEGIATRVVSMPCWELFAEQPAAKQAEVLGPGTVRVAVEAASPQGWARWGVDETTMIAMRTFGASAPAERLFAHFGITAEAVAEAVRRKL